ncbi:MAG TPA: hypothetical protein ENL03_04575 [Phycisphaerae bacterium]|nr:hypothetical protein [Phycisphaerae bacterium]
MTHRTWMLLILATALLLFAPVEAAEKLPNVTLAPEARKRLETYRKASVYTLKSILTPMVNKTAEGEEFVGARWSAESGRIVSLLKSLAKAGMIENDSPLLKKWYDDEIAAWTNVQKIGYDLLDLHYLMASTAVKIELDAEQSKAYYKWFTGYTSKTNTTMGLLKAAMEEANRHLDNLALLGPAVDKITTVLPHITDHANSVTRLAVQFHKRQLTFIKERGKLDVHRAALSRLKDKVIDPDQSGVFVGFEKDWEATMAKTYAKYVKAVAAWRKINGWHVDKEALFKTFKFLISNSVSLPATLLKADMPILEAVTYEHLEIFARMLHKDAIDAIEKYKSAKWAKIEKEIQKLNKDRQYLRKDFHATMVANEEEARKRAALAEDKCDKVVTPMQNEYNRLANLLTRETDENTMNTLARQMKDYKDKIDSAKRTLANMQHLHMETWLDDQEEIAYKKLRADIGAIDEKIDELEEAKSKLE